MNWKGSLRIRYLCARGRNEFVEYAQNDLRTQEMCVLMCFRVFRNIWECFRKKQNRKSSKTAFGKVKKPTYMRERARTERAKLWARARAASRRSSPASRHRSGLRPGAGLALRSCAAVSAFLRWLFCVPTQPSCVPTLTFLRRYADVDRFPEK